MSREALINKAIKAATEGAVPQDPAYVLNPFFTRYNYLEVKRS